MSDQGDDHNDQDRDSEDEVEGGMHAAYSIDDLVTGIDGDDEEEKNNKHDAGHENESTDDVTGQNKNGNDESVDAAIHDDSASSSAVIHQDEAESIHADEKKHEADSRSTDSVTVAESNQNAGAEMKSDSVQEKREEDESAYMSSAEIREQKRLSRESNSVSENSQEVVTNDSIYENVSDDLRPEQNQDTVFYDSVADDGAEQKGGTLVPGQGLDYNGSQGDYENIEIARKLKSETDQDGDGGWSSSEFEEYDDSGNQSLQSQESLSQGCLDAGKSKPKGKLKWPKSQSSAGATTPSTTPSTVFEKVTARLSQKFWGDTSLDSADESYLVEVTVNSEKHPPPQLPPPPEGLNAQQLKRRLIVSTIIESEKSYSASLLRLVLDYERPLLEAKPQILARDAIGTIFHKIRDILQCHNMFQIELSEMANNWDEKETIGNVFTASFSKALVYDVYKEFVVNFSSAMDMAKRNAKKIPAFAEFLKSKLESSDDRLSLFGLMVKPVQRFPQFIMLLQDLLKYTPKDHHDRLSLQLALTELETLTDRLNEAKRDSESRLEVKRLISNLNIFNTLKIDDECFLIRQDDVIEIKLKNGEPCERHRRLFLLNDQLICIDVERRDSLERFSFHWSIPINEIEIVESTLPSSYVVQVSPGKTLVSSQKKPTDQSMIPSDRNPYKKELDDMIHDLTIFQSMHQLADQLRLKYTEFCPESLRVMTRSLQKRIGDKCNIEHCLLTLALPTKYLQLSAEKQIRGQVTKQFSKVGRSKATAAETRAATKHQFTFQFASVALKHDWIQELHNTLVATDSLSHPAWYSAENDQPYRNPNFNNPLLLDITKEDSKKFLKSKKKTKDMVQCATNVTLPASTNDLGFGVQHLWVCSGDQSKGQVSIVSLYTNQPCVIESFKVCDALISSVESVPVIGNTPGAVDCVWMGTEDKKIIICKVIENDRSAKRQTISTESFVTCLKYLNTRVFAGLRNGNVLIYCYQGEAWNVKNPLKLSLGGGKISCLLPVNQTMWASSNYTIHKISVSASSKGADKESHLLSDDCGQIECMAKAGVGLLVAFSNRAVIRLYHMETLQYLQDINVASAVTPLLEGKELVSPFNEDRKLFSLSITCLLSGNGLLWVGTNLGFILTLPLPRLEGLPQVKRRPTVSLHAHSGPVKFLAAIHCGNPKSSSGVSYLATNADTKLLTNIESQTTACNSELGPVRQGKAGGERVEETESSTVASTYTDMNKCDQDAVNPCGTGRLLTLNQWSSTPDLRSFDDSDGEGDVSLMYDSLLRGVDDDMDSQLFQPGQRKGRGLNTALQQNLNAVSDQMNKIGKSIKRNVSSSRQKRRSFNQTRSFIVYSDTKTPGNGEKSSEIVSLLENGASSDGIKSQKSTTETVGDKVQDGHSSSDQLDSSERTTVVPSADANQHSSTGMVSSSYTRRTGHSKRFVVVSGGEGHVNWTEKKPFDRSYEDICLLQWKH